MADDYTRREFMWVGGTGVAGGLTGILSGCGKKPEASKPTEETTPEYLEGMFDDPKVAVPLEEALTAVLKNVSSRLSESEITGGEYSDFLFTQLKENGVISGTYRQNNNNESVGYMQALIGNKLSVKRDFGVDVDAYHFLEGTPISDKAKKDMDAYDAVEKQVGEHLQQVVGDTQVTEERFKQIVETFVLSILPENLGEYRRQTLVGRMVGTYQSQFNLLDKSETTAIGGYSQADVRKTLDKIEFK